MLRRPLGAQRNDTLVPYTTLFRSPKTHDLRRKTKDERRAGGRSRRRGRGLRPRLVRGGALGLRIGRWRRRLLPVPAGPAPPRARRRPARRSEEHTSELQSLMRTAYAVFCLEKKTKNKRQRIN